MDYHHFSQYIAGIYRRSKNDFNRQIADLNVRATQSDLLMFIYEHPGRQQGEIAQEMSVDKSLLARDLTALTTQDLVTRTPSTTDGRAKVIALTTHGEQVAQQLTATMDQWWRELFAADPLIQATELDQQLNAVYQQLLKRDRS